MTVKQTQNPGINNTTLNPVEHLPAKRLYSQAGENIVASYPSQPSVISFNRQDPRNSLVEEIAAPESHQQRSQRSHGYKGSL